MVIANVFTDPHRMLIAVAYMLIIQQIDGNVLYPRIVGGVMKVHPITILVLLLLSSNIYGVIGMVVAVPTYSIFKEITQVPSEVYENHKELKNWKNENQIKIRKPDFFDEMDYRPNKISLNSYVPSRAKDRI